MYFLPLAWLWFRLIGQLRIGWSLNPQYAYGWAVPFLCLYLIWRQAKGELRDHKTPERQDNGTGFVVSGPDFSFSAFQLFSLFLLAFLYFPTRLVLEANPGWSLATWPLAFITIGLTLLLLPTTHHAPRTTRLTPSRPPFQLSASQPASVSAFQRFSVSDFVFPICFFLVAVPWPHLIESPIIQGLTRLNTALTVEILSLLGIPAMPRGNVIELATGSVGIDEACSGIRSLQATVMISLFLGELCRLSVSRRLVCVLGGFALAMVCNLARTLLLCWVAAYRGVDAIAGWHDPAGVTILVACFLGIWGLAWSLQKTEANRRKAKMASVGPLSCETRRPPPTEPVAQASSPVNACCVAATPVSSLRPPAPAPFSVSAFQSFSILLTAWLLLVDLGVAGWYRHIEANLPASAVWHIAWPPTNAVCRDVPIGHEATKMLRYDEARQLQWVEANNTRWQLSWFYWKPGQAAAYLAKTHNPLICMPAAGFQVASVSPVEVVNIGGLRMPVRRYQFTDEHNSIHVLYSRWEDRAVEQPFGSEGVTRLNRLRSVWKGRGNQGQRVISLALWSGDDAQSARKQLLGQLQNLLVVNPSRHGTP